MFRTWLPSLPTDVDLALARLPGRETRMMEPAVPQMPELIEAMGPGLVDIMDGNHVLFGHSMGSIVAFELALWAKRNDLPPPRAIVVAAHRGPDVAYPRAPVHGLPREELLEEVRALGGTPPEILEHPELLDLVLPTIRADMELCETYKPSEGKVDCPMYVFGGAQDEGVPPDHLDPWAQRSTSTVKLDVLQGDHFFPHDAASGFQGRLAAVLGEL